MSKRRLNKQLMSLTYNKSYQAYRILDKLLKFDSENKIVLATRVRAKIASNLRKVKEAYDYVLSEKNRLVAKLGTNVVDSNGKETGEFRIEPATEAHDSFVKEFGELLDSDSDVEIKPITQWELAGVTEEVYNDTSSDPAKQNQIPTDLVVELLDIGLITE